MAAEPGIPRGHNSAEGQPLLNEVRRGSPAMSNDYARASKVLQRNRKQLLKVRGVHGLAVGRLADHGGGEGVCLVVYVDSTVDRHALPQEIEGFIVYTIP